MEAIIRKNGKSLNNLGATFFYTLVKESEKHPKLQDLFLYWPKQDKVLIAQEVEEAFDHKVISCKDFPVVLHMWEDGLCKVVLHMKGFQIWLNLDKKNFFAREVFNRVEQFLAMREPYTNTGERFRNVMENSMLEVNDFLWDITYDISQPKAIVIRIDTREYQFEWTMSPSHMRHVPGCDVVNYYHIMLRRGYKNMEGRYFYRMMKFCRYVPASKVFKQETDHIDYGHADGFLRGYSIQVEDEKGNLSWLAPEYVDDDPDYALGDFCHEQEYLELCRWPTNRIVFLGYFKYVRNSTVVPVNDWEIKRNLGII